MHMPDPSTFTLVTAIVNLAIAITGTIRLILDRRSRPKNDEDEAKDSKKTRRWLELGRAVNRLTHTSVAFSKNPSAVIMIIAPDWTRKPWEFMTSKNLDILCAAHHGSLQKKLI